MQKTEAMLKEEEKKISLFEFPVYCASIVSHNACIYEMNKILENKNLFYDFPYGKQVFSITQIENITSTLVTEDEVKNFYSKSKRDEYYNKRVKQRDNKSEQWRRVEATYFIEDGGSKKLFLREHPQIRRDDIITQMKMNNNNESKELPLKVLDGIYFLEDFLRKNHDQQQMQLIDKYVEKLLESFNKSVIYNMITFFVINCLLKLAQRGIFVDIGIHNFVLVRIGSTLKFVYLLSFENFKDDLEEALSNQNQFNYQAFSEIYYHKPPILSLASSQNQHNSQITYSNRLLNDKFHERCLLFLKKIGESILNEKDKINPINDCQFFKDFSYKEQPIEDIVRLHELKKRYCKALISKNQILTAMENNKRVKDIFLKLYTYEQNFFKQDCLKCGTMKDFLQKDSTNAKEIPTFVEFICEDYPKFGINQGGGISSSREKSKTPKILQETGVAQEHEIASVNANHRDMYMMVRIRESHVPYREEENIRKNIEQLRPQQNQNSERIKKLEKDLVYLQQNQGQTVGKGAEKKIIIEYQESICTLSIKLFFPSDMVVTYEITDEIMYVMQLLNSLSTHVTLYMDDNKRLFFQSFIQLGSPDPILLRFIQMVDILLLYSITFFDFFWTSLLGSKTSRDQAKYTSLVHEIKTYLASYQHSFSTFKATLLNESS